jgi:uncharacterized membrane protein
VVQYQPTPDARESIAVEGKTADGRAGLVRPVWYRFFSDVWRRANALQTDIDAVEAEVDALQSHTSTLGTYTALASTATTLSGIPTNARMVVLNISGMSWDATAAPRIRIGPSGGVATSGYLGASGDFADSSTPVALNFTAGFDLRSQPATAVFHGSVAFTLADASTNRWACAGTIGRTDAANVQFVAGTVPLSGALERIAITTVAGTATADAGSVSLLIYT